MSIYTRRQKQVENIIEWNERGRRVHYSSVPDLLLQDGAMMAACWRSDGTIYSRERICLATCCGRVNVAWQTGHLWSPAIVVVVIGVDVGECSVGGSTESVRVKLRGWVVLRALSN